MDGMVSIPVRPPAICDDSAGTGDDIGIADTPSLFGGKSDIAEGIDTLYPALLGIIGLHHISQDTSCECSISVCYVGVF